MQIQREVGGEVYFISDPHFFHPLVSRNHNFWTLDRDGIQVGDPEMHNLVLEDNWTSLIKPKDTVYLLGDISVRKEAQALQLLRRLHGKKHLISGNHDETHTGVWPTRYKEAVKRFDSTFETIQDELILEIAGKPVTLNHFPYWSYGDGPNRPTARYQNLRPAETRDSILLHGHTHGNEREHGRQFHVGLDAWGLKPVPLEVVEEWVRGLD